MNDQKRLFLAFALVAAFMYAWFTFVVPQPHPGKPKPSTGEPQTPTSTSATVVPSGQPPSPIAAPVHTVPSIIRVVQTDLTESTFSNLPASITKLTLKRFRTTASKNAPPVTIIPFMGDASPPLKWTFEVDGQNFSDDISAYLEISAEPKKLVYERPLLPDVTVRKTFVVNNGSYLVDEAVEILNRGSGARRILARVSLAAGTSASQERSTMNPGDPLHLTAYINERAIRLSLSDVAKKTALPTGDIEWAGFDSRYFMVTALPGEGRWAELNYQTEARDPALDTGKADNIRQVNLWATYPPRVLSAGATQKYALKFYGGPKDIGILRTVSPTLDHAIDLGDWLGPIARPILVFLRWLHSVIPNYGVAIILLTVLVRLLLFPLTQMQAKSMKKMQEHKPEMDALKEKFADNKEAYSKELMGYMRRHRINPMGGCLLLLPQMPIFFALYRVLYNSIELRQAPFVFWIRDLSAHDPFFVMPVLLGIVMFIQQRMTPTPGADPAQQTMMKIMPVMFSVFMLFLPAGLNLYIFVSTLWGIGQQLWVQGKLPLFAKAKT